ncbi:6301_t:CDS:2, partial [Acaulospora morrowiae]
SRCVVLEMVKQKKAVTSKGDDSKKGIKDDAEQKVLDYLRKQNRPYSVTDISNNLHNAITKAAIQKALTNLVDKEEVGCKTYGKQSVYVVKQVRITNSQLNEMDVKIEELKKEVNDYKDRNKQLQS